VRLIEFKGNVDLQSQYFGEEENTNSKMGVQE